MRRLFSSILSIVYLVVGVVVADGHHFFTHLNHVKEIASAILAVILWPLVEIGVNLHIH